MPHLDFNYPGLGEAYRVFSQKHARLLSVRDKTEQPLARHVRRMEDDLQAQHAVEQSHEEGLYVLGGMTVPYGGIDILDLYEDERQWQGRVLRTVREMELGYLVAMTDAFIGRWREENDLPAGRSPESSRWYSATEHNINLTIADLHATRPDIPLRTVRADTAVRLKAVRDQRDTVMHRDSEGLDDVTDADLDGALLTLNSLARALAFVTHPPLPHDGDGRERDAFIAEALEEDNGDAR